VLSWQHFILLTVVISGFTFGERAMEPGGSPTVEPTRLSMEGLMPEPTMAFAAITGAATTATGPMG
jgi:hypothetical protein